ncbi:anaerobic ribonucleoside-triphosphate reductase activating protein [Desulfosarcina ovata]|nr:anaerobic ribonucleoside-triphosphate reductase activating protein [Desulfosarcina ovata]
MILAGFQKNSFIDYPGKISCVLFVTGCNFICPYCHNADLARGEYPERIELETVLDFLASRQGMLEGVVITGGEPSLNKRIADLCGLIKTLGYPVKLDTNGSRPDVLGRLLDEHLVDFVAMDIKAPLDRYHPFCVQPQIADRLMESIRLIMASAPAYEFRTTCVKPFVDAAAMATIAQTIQGADRYVLQPFNRRAACLDPAFNGEPDPTLLPDAMGELKVVAEPFVGHCAIR